MQNVRINKEEKLKGERGESAQKRRVIHRKNRELGRYPPETTRKASKMRFVHTIFMSIRLQRN